MNTLQVNPMTGEVFLRLPAPHENIIITPPRDSDAADLVLILNDPRVYKFLLEPPFPYYLHHAEEWLEMVKKRSDEILEDLREGKTVVDGCPVQYIREVQPDGTDLLLGDLSVTRNGWMEVSDKELREKMTKENLEKPIGDPTIVWTIGDYLRSSHHGKGIMSAAVGMVINQWMIPHLNAHKIHTEAFEGNMGSVRVFEKNGLKLLETVKVELVGPGCGRIEGMHVLEWERPGK
ncbi:hypothetical protein BDM02DRAFT_3093385 [Thelephora ganbajun]|uniref:Uncharacterized protein n=1 Tax=Thelephora ganbajun TaxID=370292 RepID=A0ACB6ZL34_THEGA|nr:hypothetical protein BDM02DRAFT_3093385 [Thelephora ganbajun]